MTRYQYKDPVIPDPDCTWDQQKCWIRRRREQLEEHFDDFLTSREGRFYVLFGGSRAGKTSLLKTIHYQFPPKTPEPRENCRSVLVDLDTAGHLSSPKEFFKLLYTKIRGQLGVCSIDPNIVARLFQEEIKALDDFKQAFRLIVWELDPTSTRLILLLDNADILAETSFAPELFADFVKLFASPDCIRDVTSQLDIVIAGSGPLYDKLSKTRFSRQLKHWYNIKVFPEDITQALIADLPAIKNQPDLIGKIARYTGGQPYLLQYFMAQLETATLIDQSVTDDAIEQVVAACLEPRSEIESWCYDCSEAIKEQGSHPVYAALTTGQTMGWPRIKATIQERQLGDTAKLLGPAVDRALDTLVFHGLVRHDRVGKTSRYIITSELFKQWFVNNILSPEERSEITMSQQELAMTLLTSTIPILYDVLKWLWKERERDREDESTELSPPSKSPEATPAEAASRPSVSTPDALLAVLKEVDLAAKRDTLDRFASLGRQLKSRRENINLWEEELTEMPVGRERLSLRKGFRRERDEVERITQEMQEIVERLSGHQVVVAK